MGSVWSVSVWSGECVECEWGGVWQCELGVESVNGECVSVSGECVM